MAGLFFVVNGLQLLSLSQSVKAPSQAALLAGSGVTVHDTLNYCSIYLADGSPECFECLLLGEGTYERTNTGLNHTVAQIAFE